MATISICELRIVREDKEVYGLGDNISNPEMARNTINEIYDLDAQPEEVFCAIYLNTKHCVEAAHIVSKGSLNASIVHPREVFKPAFLHNASAVMVFHNHPSGDPTPSREDINVTKRLKDAGEMLGIDLLDHIIVAGNIYHSIREGREVKW